MNAFSASPGELPLEAALSLGPRGSDRARGFEGSAGSSGAVPPVPPSGGAREVVPPEPLNVSEVARFVAEAASHAPSVYNTSPWWFSTTETAVCLHADTERRLPVADPSGREMALSCGAAVFTARLAFRYLGLVPKVSVLPDLGLPNLIAKLICEERKPPSDYERRLFDEIAVRSNHRGGFGSDRLPTGLISTLRVEAARENAKLQVMPDDEHRATLLSVLATAHAAFRLDHARVQEEETWHPPGRTPARDPGWGARPKEPGTTPGSLGVVTVLATAADDRVNWISAGQALQRVLLIAGTRGVSVAMSARPLEFSQLRDFISSELLDGDSPQMVLSFGVDH
jgi:hypothetical protein